MWNKPTPRQLSKLPALYATDHIPAREKVIHMHFFRGASDWYVAEYGDGRFFGFVILNGDTQMSEWGYFDLDGLARFTGFVEVDRDVTFTPTQAKNIPTIRHAQGWD